MLCRNSRKCLKLPAKSDVNDNEVEEGDDDTVEVDASEWPLLANHIEELKSGRFKSLTVGKGPTRRAVRISAHVGQENALITVPNRLVTLC